MSEGRGMQPSGTWALKPLDEMSSAEFHDWQALLEERTGLVVTEQRRLFLQTGLVTRMRELGVDDYASYYRQVISGPSGAVEWSQLLDRLTVQETCFYRHLPSFEALDTHLRRRCAQGALERPLALWSVGCSSGEEAYSLAIAATAVLADHGQPYLFGVTGTDISGSALARAREACYPLRRLQQLAPALLERYLEPQGNGRYRVIPALAERVCYTRLNVLDLAQAPMSGLDVIFCQNLLIYFRRWRRREILNRLAERLAPGGLLMIGVGEVAGWEHPQLEPLADQRVLAFTRKGQQPL
jgi:type IV pilus assembly protein PilK